MEIVGDAERPVYVHRLPAPNNTSCVIEGRKAQRDSRKRQLSDVNIR